MFVSGSLIRDFSKKQTTTRMTSNVVVEQIALFTLLQFLLRTYMKSDERIQKPRVCSYVLELLVAS